MSEKDQKTTKEIRAKKIATAKKIFGGIAKFCVSAFFGAVAADVANRSKPNKIERGIAVAGGMFVGSMIGDQVSDYVCSGIDKLTEEYGKIEEASEESAA